MSWWRPWTWRPSRAGFDVVLVFHDDEARVRATIKLHVNRPTRVHFTQPIRATRLLISVDR